jgi:hypothetical protein
VTVVLVAVVLFAVVLVIAVLVAAVLVAVHPADERSHLDQTPLTLTL